MGCAGRGFWCDLVFKPFKTFNRYAPFKIVQPIGIGREASEGKGLRLYRPVEKHWNQAGQKSPATRRAKIDERRRTYAVRLEQGD
jgi:hypothetical protein